MEDYIAISTLNDYLYCPRSLYLHLSLGELEPSAFHSIHQTRGKIAHNKVDSHQYSSKKNVLQNHAVYSHNLKIFGYIDIYDLDSGVLTERKALLKHIFEGHLIQLWTQYFCLVEMGYEPKILRIHSMLDNKSYPVELPKINQYIQIYNLIQEMNNMSVDKLLNHHCNNCNDNIYSPLSWDKPC